MKYAHVFLKPLSSSQNENRFPQTMENEMHALARVWMELISVLDSGLGVSSAKAERLLKKTPQMSYNSKGILFFSLPLYESAQGVS